MFKNSIFTRAHKLSTQNLRYRLQLLIAGFLFPVGKGDWYAQKGYGKNGMTAFDDFLTSQRMPTAKYYNDFKSLHLSLTSVTSKLANNKACDIETLHCVPKISKLPGAGKHIVYFPGANTYYQACFRDITTAARETGASIHAFNFPGTGASTGRVLEANDLINAGIAVVNNLIRQGIHPDKIILQGDCFGAAIALEVKKQFEKQSDIKLRIIMNNAFKSFRAVIAKMIQDLIWLPSSLNAVIKKLLIFTGWHETPGKRFRRSSPYQYYIQHEGDQTLNGITLDDKIRKYRRPARKGNYKYFDPCPREYRKVRDFFEQRKNRYVRVKAESIQRLREKFGQDKNGNVNAHFADLCECETLSGESAYSGLVNKYLAASQEYVDRNTQAYNSEKNPLPRYLNQSNYVEPSLYEAEQFDMIADCLSEGRKYIEVDAHAKSSVNLKA